MLCDRVVGWWSSSAAVHDSVSPYHTAAVYFQHIAAEAFFVELFFCEVKLLFCQDSIPLSGNDYLQYNYDKNEMYDGSSFSTVLISTTLQNKYKWIFFKLSFSLTFIL